MIEYIFGKIINKTPTSVIIDIGNIGFNIYITVNTYSSLPDVGENIKLFIRENFSVTSGREGIELYGFNSLSEREMFSLLKKVSKIGARTALKILSSTEITRLKTAISTSDINFLSRIKGIGKKTAQRLILELKEKISISSLEEEPMAEDAVGALTSLGYGRAEAYKAVSIILKENKNITIEELIRQSLLKL